MRGAWLEVTSAAEGLIGTVVAAVTGGAWLVTVDQVALAPRQASDVTQVVAGDVSGRRAMTGRLQGRGSWGRLLRPWDARLVFERLSGVRLLTKHAEQEY